MSITPHPGLPEFDYIKPGSLAEASQFLAEHAGEARLFSGGTDVFVRMRDGLWTEKYLVDVKALEGMNEIAFDLSSGLTVGAAVNMNRVAAFPAVKEFYPLLEDAIRTVASYQLRSRATIIGNICNASPAGDTVGACLVLDAVLKVHGVDGFREEALNSFFLGPGKTVLKPGDIVTSIRFPIPPAGYAAKYIKLGRNAIGDLAIVGVTVLGYPDASAASGYRFRIALASVAPVPLRPVKAEELLASRQILPETLEEASILAMDASSPIDDVRSGARYRKLMVRNLTLKALKIVWDKIH
jgi:CO/xanthine dehydrogenase FAD-binding subunit